MNILGLVEIRSNTQFFRIGADIAQGRVGRLLHHVTQVAGKLQLAGALHDIDFHLQRLAADGGPSQPGYQTNLIVDRQAVRQELADAQETLHIGAGDGDLLRRFLLQNGHIRFAADLRKAPFQLPNAGFSGIAGNNLPNSIVCDPQLRLFQAVLFHLLGDQMVLSDHQLFFIGIGAQLNDLHTVQQGSGNRIQGIGSGNEDAIRKIVRDFQIVIAVGGILLAIQHFQQCRAGIAAVVGTHFIDFIQQKNRVA